MARPTKFKKGPMSGKERTARYRKRLERELRLAAPNVKAERRTQRFEARSGVAVEDAKYLRRPCDHLGSRDTGLDRAADNHYPTMTTDEIAALDVPSICALHAVLFLWATVPMLLDALRVMAAWGFEYKSQMVWDKIDMGNGYWVRNQHEILLIGTKGDIPAPAMGKQLRSVFREKAREHSRKPDAIAEWIERTYPTIPKCELFCRGAPRPGWKAWGNEADETAE